MGPSAQNSEPFDLRAFRIEYQFSNGCYLSFI